MLYTLKSLKFKLEKRFFVESYFNRFIEDNLDSLSNGPIQIYYIFTYSKLTIGSSSSVWSFNVLEY